MVLGEPVADRVGRSVMVCMGENLRRAKSNPVILGWRNGVPASRGFFIRRLASLLLESMIAARDQ